MSSNGESRVEGGEGKGRGSPAPPATRTRSQARAAASRSVTSRVRRESIEGSPTKGAGPSGGSREVAGQETVADPHSLEQTSELATDSTARTAPVSPPKLLSLARGTSTPYNSRHASRMSSMGPARRVPRTTIPAHHAPPIVVSSSDDIPVPTSAIPPPLVSGPVCMSYVDAVKAGGSTPTSPVSPALKTGKGKGRAP